MIAFTSGCFDLLHEGHLHLLREMNKMADKVVISVNCDEYIVKHKNRKPGVTLVDRMYALANTGLVDDVYALYEDGPIKIIMDVKPDYIFVGNDYSIDRVVGAEEAKEWGGEVIIIRRLPDLSTTKLMEKNHKYG